MKMVKKKFEGQLAGQKKKESWFGALREELDISLPKVGAAIEVSLKPSKLNGAFLSCLDGGGSLTINGKKVSKMKVYSGVEHIPAVYSLKMKIARVSDANCKLSAEVTGK